MKKKQLIEIAKRISDNEKIIQTSKDKDLVQQAMVEIITLADNENLTLEDLFELDELIQDSLS